MLINLREYHRPAAEGRGLADALALLVRPYIRTVVLAGGDTLLASADPTVEAVVDLQGLGLDEIRFDDAGRTLHIGALVTRAALSDDGRPTTDDGRLAAFLGECAARWSGSVQRNRATVGGAAVIAADNDPLAAALLACDAEVVLASQAGEQVIPFADFLPQRAALLAAPAIVTALRVALPAAEPDEGTRGTGWQPVPRKVTGYALATVERTPSDAPVVLAAAALTVADGRCTAARLVLGGVAPAPLRVIPVEAVLTGQPLAPDVIADAAVQVASRVHPTGDFRGSAEYRREMAVVLAQRALNQAGRL